MGKKHTPGNYMNEYGAFEAANSKEPVLPDKLQCVQCKKWKAQPNYSNRALSDAKEAISGSYQTSPHISIRCRTCTPQQVVELTCFMCGKTKDLTGFSKQQRKNPDRAKCFPCMQKQLNMEPSYGDDGDEDDEDENRSECESDSSGDSRPSTLLATQISQLSTIDDDNTSVNSGSSSAFSHPNAAKWSIATLRKSGLSTRSTLSTTTDGSIGGVPIDARSETATSASSDPTIIMGTNNNHYGFRNSRSDYTSTPSYAAGTTASNNKNSKWAKVPAFKPAQPENLQKSDDEDSDGEDDDDDWGLEFESDDDDEPDEYD